MTKGTTIATDVQRQRLNFAHAVARHFQFVSDYGFSLAESSPTIVRYRNGDRQINVYHGRTSYEIGLEITFGGDSYSLAAIVRLSDKERADSFRHYMTATPEGVISGVQQLAKLLERYGQDALRGDPATFSALAMQKDQIARNLELDSIAAQIRPRAEAAFRAHKYQEAAELYERIRLQLSASELRKLEISKQRSDQ